MTWAWVLDDGMGRYGPVQMTIQTTHRGNTFQYSAVRTEVANEIAHRRSPGVFTFLFDACYGGRHKDCGGIGTLPTKVYSPVACTCHCHPGQPNRGLPAHQDQEVPVPSNEDYPHIGDDSRRPRPVRVTREQLAKAKQFNFWCVGEDGTELIQLRDGENTTLVPFVMAD